MASVTNIRKKSNSHNIVGSMSFKQQVINELQPSYLKDIKHAMFWKTEWYKVTNSLHTAAEVLIMISVILTFVSASAIIDAENVSICALVAGGIGVVSRSLELFSKSTKKKSQKNTDDLNELLGGLGIDHRVPDIANDYNSLEEGSRDESKDDSENDVNLGDFEMGLMRKKSGTDSPDKQKVKITKATI
jgi:hypothetical protein